jgi:ketosteroid isomerase-like protein
MPAPLRQIVHDYLGALASRDVVAMAQYLADDVDVMLYGPVDLFPFFGRQLGKAEVLRRFGNVSGYLHFRKYECEHVLVDGNDVAAFVQAAAEVIETGRVISWHMAMFMRFESGLLKRARYVIDTFDMVEQVVGRELAIA